MATDQLCTFYVDRHFFGLPVSQVQEVIRNQPMTRVPLAPPVVQGLINLRGQIVTAVDMRTRLGLPPRADGVEPMNVVLRSESGTTSLLVDEIGDVLEPDDSERESAPETLDASLREMLVAVYKLEKRLLLVLDPEKALAAADTRRGRDARAA